MQAQPQRCQWATKAVFHHYHDTEWGTPLHNDQRHFEYLILDGAQAGLSWEIILRKREGYRAAFANWNVEQVARFSEREVMQLLQNNAIVRNRRKIESAIGNARAFLQIQARYGSFDSYLWSFVDGQPIINHWQKMEDIPARTSLSDTISQDLKKRGFSFVGSTIIYAYLQGAGVVNDHQVNCFRYQQLTSDMKLN